MFGFEPGQLVDINKKDYPALMMSSKLKKDTRIKLPPPDMRWILTKQISKHKPEGKKKRVYTVQDIEPPYQSYVDIESYRVQEFPQLGNTYAQHEVVCALYPNIDGNSHEFSHPVQCISGRSFRALTRSS